jgi:hypothetical protein
MAKDGVAGPAPLKYPQIKVPRLKGSEQLMDHERKPISTVLKFWQWAYSGLSDNITRGVLAEFLVASAVGATKGVRDPWAAHDVEDPRGFGIEVKSTAYIQTWAHAERSQIAFDCAPTRVFNPETNKVAPLPGRHSPIYVFALQAMKDQAKLDMLDSSQWEFYVVPTWWIDTPAAGRRNISLETLRASAQFGEPVSYRHLAARVGVVAGLGTA